MHVGEPVAMVIAETALAAQDAAELVSVDYEEFAPVVDARAALDPDAVQLWPEAPGNIAVDWPGPAKDPDANAQEVERDHRVRQASLPASKRSQSAARGRDSMEPRGATASYDTATDRYTLRVCSQSAGALRDNVIAIMNWPKERLRVITEDVGGAFGLKTGAYPDYIAVLVGREAARAAGALDVDAARKRSSATARRATPLPRASWRSTRRANSSRCASATSAIWAPISARSAPICRRMNFARCFPGMYDIKHIDVSARCVFTNTLPTSPYRGAGRPEANYVLENAGRGGRAHDRHRSGQAAPAQPHPAVGHAVQDRGRHHLRLRRIRPIVLDKALALADYAGFKQAQARGRQARQASRHRHLLRARTCRRRAARERGAVVSGRRDRGAGAQRAVDRPGPSDGVPAACRRRGSASPAEHRSRHRHGDSDLELSRHGLGRLALGDDGGQRHRQDRRHDAGEGQDDRRQRAGGRRSRHRLPGRPLRGGRHRPPHLAVRTRRRAPPR